MLSRALWLGPLHFWQVHPKAIIRGDAHPPWLSSSPTTTSRRPLVTPHSSTARTILLTHSLLFSLLLSLPLPVRALSFEPVLPPPPPLTRSIPLSCSSIPHLHDPGTNQGHEISYRPSHAGISLPPAIWSPTPASTRSSIAAWPVSFWACISTATVPTVHSSARESPQPVSTAAYSSGAGVPNISVVPARHAQFVCSCISTCSPATICVDRTLETRVGGETGQQV